jgi:hypothetical protein
LFWGKRNELEQIFITCVEAVKKEVQKRRPEKSPVIDLLSNTEHFTQADKREVINLLL